MHTSAVRKLLRHCLYFTHSSTESYQTLM